MPNKLRFTAIGFDYQTKVHLKYDNLYGLDGEILE